jgi:hypothetical protein
MRAVAAGVAKPALLKGNQTTKSALETNGNVKSAKNTSENPITNQPFLEYFINQGISPIFKLLFTK